MQLACTSATISWHKGIYIRLRSWRLVTALYFLLRRLLPSTSFDAIRTNKKFSRFFVEYSLLWKRLQSSALEMLVVDEVKTVLREIHSRVRGEHQEVDADSLGLLPTIEVDAAFITANLLGLLLPTIAVDAASFVQRCQACQFNSNRIHAFIVELLSLYTPCTIPHLDLWFDWSYQLAISWSHLDPIYNIMLH